METLAPATVVQSTERHSGITGGLPMGALYAWIYAFPLFGPALTATASGATQLTPAFIWGHGLSLVLLHLLPRKVGTHPHLYRLSGVLVFLLTGLCVFFPDYGFSAINFGVMGVLSANLILGWVPWFTNQGKPVQTLAVVLVTAKIGLVLTYPLMIVAGEWSLVVLGSLVLLAGFYFPADDHAPTLANTRTVTAIRETVHLPSIVWGISAFVIAYFFAGGIWHQVINARFYEVWPTGGIIDPLIYVTGLIPFACASRKGRPGDLAGVSLSALGLGLLVSTAGQVSLTAVIASQTLFMLGFAAADLFFWLSLWTLGQMFPARRVFGLAIGLSLPLIAAAGLIDGNATAQDTSLPEIIGAGVLFLTAPVILRNTFPGLKPESPVIASHEQSPIETVKLEARQSTEPDQPEEPVGLPLPEALTPAEARIYNLLLEGAKDTEIADRLFISKNTVKFHVRNILRKTGVTNRRELLALVLEHSLHPLSSQSNNEPRENSQGSI